MTDFGIVTIPTHYTIHRWSLLAGWKRTVLNLSSLENIPIFRRVASVRSLAVETCQVTIVSFLTPLLA